MDANEILADLIKNKEECAKLNDEFVYASKDVWGYAHIRQNGRIFGFSMLSPTKEQAELMHKERIENARHHFFPGRAEQLADYYSRMSLVHMQIVEIIK